MFKDEKGIRQLGPRIMLMEAHTGESIWLTVALTDDEGRGRLTDACSPDTAAELSGGPAATPSAVTEGPPTCRRHEQLFLIVNIMSSVKC